MMTLKMEESSEWYPTLNTHCRPLSVVVIELSMCPLLFPCRRLDGRLFVL